MSITSGKPDTQRHVLQAARTYYIRTDGDDANDGLADTAAQAWRTMQKAANVLMNDIEIGEWSVTINVADGTYFDPTSGASIMRMRNVQGEVNIIGNVTNPENCVWNIGYYGYGFVIENCNKVKIEGFHLNEYDSYTSGYSAFALDHHSVVEINAMKLGGVVNTMEVFQIFNIQNFSQVKHTNSPNGFINGIENIYFINNFVSMQKHCSMTAGAFVVEPGESFYLYDPAIVLDEHCSYTYVSADAVQLGAGASIDGSGERQFILTNHSYIKKDSATVTGETDWPGELPGILDTTCSYSGQTLGNYTNHQTLTANFTVKPNELIDGGKLQILDNTTAVDVTVNDPGLFDQKEYIVANLASATNDITLKNEGGATLSTISPGGQAMIVWGGAVIDDWVVI